MSDTVKRATPRKGEPKYDTKKTVEDNVFRMKTEHRLPWNRIEALCGLQGRGSGRAAYRRACAERGEQPQTFKRQAAAKAEK